MKKITSKNILLVVFILVQNFLIAQTISSLNNTENKLPIKTISFGQKIDFPYVENSSTWIIKNTTSNSSINLSGTQINDFVFENPGTFEILYSDNLAHLKEDCNHAHFPAKTILEVSPVNMTFDFSKITFSEVIKKQTNYDNVIVTVPVKINTYQNKQQSVSIPNAFVAGIDVNLKLIPASNEIIAKNGIETLNYKLSGIVKNETYLMFDFKDCNNQVQTYNLLDKIY